MSKLTQVVMELAREPGHPHGDRDRGYQLRLPLAEDGRIDEDAFEQLGNACTVKRIRPGEEPRYGLLRRGVSGQWSFDYDDRQEFEDELAFRLAEERFVPGEYISIREDDGTMHTFQIISVRPWN
ncbi:MAG: hypothetical protein ACTHLT_14700 [Devosia sp.]